MDAVENVDAGRYESHDLIDPEDYRSGKLKGAAG